MATSLDKKQDDSFLFRCNFVGNHISTTWCWIASIVFFKNTFSLFSMHFIVHIFYVTSSFWRFHFVEKWNIGIKQVSIGEVSYVIKYLIQCLGNIFHYQITTLHSCEENTNYYIMYSLQYLFAHIHVRIGVFMFRWPVCVTGPLVCPKVSTMLSNISFQEAICLHHCWYSINSDTSPQSGNLIIDGILFIHFNLPVYVPF